MLGISIPTNVTSILFDLKNVLELNFVQRETILALYEKSPASYRAHEAGGCLVSWFIPLVGAILLIVLLMKIVLKHTDIQIYWCVERTFEFMFYSLPLRVMLLTFLTFCIVAAHGEIWCMIYCPFIAVAVYNFFIFMESHELNIQSTRAKFSTLYEELKTSR
jgi:Ca2+/Na+ antiporter